jgi:hypothetical protein
MSIAVSGNSFSISWLVSDLDLALLARFSKLDISIAGSFFVSVLAINLEYNA